MSKSNTIEINGKRYDAKTGALLSSTTPSATSRPTKPNPVKQESPTKLKPATPSTVRSAAKTIASHAPAHSRTLMRQAVKKPDANLKRSYKAQGHTDTLAQPLNQVIVKPSVRRLDEKRLRHAKQIPHSQLISRFPAVTSDAFSQQPITPVPEKPAKPTVSHAHAAHATQPASHTHQRVQKPQTTADILERAIQQSTSHLQTFDEPSKSRHEHLKRNTSIGAAIGLSVVLLGVIVNQNLANVRLQMASAKAGFNVSLPNYRPAGYGLGQLDYNEGVAAVQFHSNSDDRHYTITQKLSPWNSQTLMRNFVTPNDAQYQTVNSHGLTIYLYDNDSATWVNHGIWYIIQSDGSLSDSQLVNLATSL